MENNQNNGTGVSVQGERINNLEFADDIDLLKNIVEIDYKKMSAD